MMVGEACEVGEVDELLVLSVECQAAVPVTVSRLLAPLPVQRAAAFHCNRSNTMLIGVVLYTVSQKKRHIIFSKDFSHLTYLMQQCNCITLEISQTLKK